MGVPGNHVSFYVNWRLSREPSAQTNDPEGYMGRGMTGFHGTDLSACCLRSLLSALASVPLAPSRRSRAVLPVRSLLCTLAPLSIRNVALA
jgi:hypothetical protein